MNRNLLLVIISVFIVGAMIFYFFVDPTTAPYAFKCPFHFFTGLDCPSCGTQRALHAALHGEFHKAVSFNPFLFVSLPYLFAVIWGSFPALPAAGRMQRIFHSQPAVIIYLILLIFWWIFRNL